MDSLSYVAISIRDEEATPKVEAEHTPRLQLGSDYTCDLFVFMYSWAMAIAQLLTLYPYLHLPRNEYPLGPVWVIFGVQSATMLVLAAVFIVLSCISMTKAAVSYSSILKIFLDISCISLIVSLFSWTFILTAVLSYNINWIEYSLACVIFFMIVAAHYMIRKKVYDIGDASHYKDKTKIILLSDIGVLAPLMFLSVALIHHRLPWIRYLVVCVITAIMFACFFFDYMMLIKREYAYMRRGRNSSREDNAGNIKHCDESLVISCRI